MSHGRKMTEKRFRTIKREKKKETAYDISCVKIARGHIFISLPSVVYAHLSPAFCLRGHFMIITLPPFFLGAWVKMFKMRQNKKQRLGGLRTSPTLSFDRVLMTIVYFLVRPIFWPLTQCPGKSRQAPSNSDRLPFCARTCKKK